MAESKPVSEEQVKWQEELKELSAKIKILEAAQKHEAENNALVELKDIKQELKKLKKALYTVVEKIINLEMRHCEHCQETRKTNKTNKTNCCTLSVFPCF